MIENNMNANNELQKEVNMQEEHSKGLTKSFWKKVEKYIRESNILLKVIGIISGLCSACYFIQNILFKINCEKLYGIPASYFSYNADHNIIVIIDLIFVIGMFFYAYFLENDSKQLKGVYIADWLYKLGTGFVIGYFCVCIYYNMIKKYVIESNAIIDILIVISFFIVFLCGTASIFIALGKKIKMLFFSVFVIAVTLMVITCGVINELNLLNKEKTAYEFVKIEDEEFAILSKVDDKILVVPFEYDQTGKCHIKTSQYTFKNKYEGTYYYVDFNYYPIIEK